MIYCLGTKDRPTVPSLIFTKGNPSELLQMRDASSKIQRFLKGVRGFILMRGGLTNFEILNWARPEWKQQFFWRGGNTKPISGILIPALLTKKIKIFLHCL